jgi:hypothetical protein
MEKVGEVVHDDCVGQLLNRQHVQRGEVLPQLRLFREVADVHARELCRAPGDALKQQRRSVLQLLWAADVEHSTVGMRGRHLVRVLEEQRAAPAVVQHEGTLGIWGVLNWVGDDEIALDRTLLITRAHRHA